MQKYLGKYNGFEIAFGFALGIIGACLLLFFVIIHNFQLMPMASTSMEPLIHGESMAGAGDGDLVVVKRRVNLQDLHPGELVLVSMLPEGRTIREVRQIEWPSAGGNPVVVVGSPNTNNLFNGTINVSDIIGKVIYVYHRRKREAE